MAVIASFVLIAAGNLIAILARKKIGHSSAKHCRLLWTVPVLVLFVIAPCVVTVSEAAIIQGIEAWCVAWVGGTKLVSIALGTSSIDVDCSALQFLLQLALPILPVDKIRHPDARGQTTASIFIKLVVAIIVQVFIFVPLTRDIAAQTWKPHPVVDTIIVCGVLWSFLEMLFHSINLLAAAFGVATNPCMRNPFLTSSLRDFWARRWNLPTSASLRTTFYDPLQALMAPSPPTHSMHEPQSNCSSTATSTGSSSALSGLTPRKVTNSQLPSSTGTHSDSTTIKRLNRDTDHRAAGSSRNESVAFLGLSLAFFVSGVVHHWILSLFCRGDLSDIRFALLFWIQPPLIAIQEVWTRSKWWRGVRAQAPAVAWAAQWASSLVMFMVPLWYLMRNPFLDNEGGRAFVLYAMRDISSSCTAALPQNVCSAVTRVEPLLDAAFGR